MLSVRHVTRAFDNVPVLRGVDLDVERREILCVLGPSGCGKTTLLRVIAGLEQTDTGDVLLNGQSILGVPVHERDFGLMFQDFALFPHMNVAQNIVFGLRMRRRARPAREERLRQVLELVGLAGSESRDVTQLSGGERQRVALARSLAPNPRLLMLDEPLGSLDATLRERLVVDLRSIIKQVGLTALYVTHDQQEAFAVSDRIAIMNTGRIEQIGTPESVYRQPKTVFVARFLGLNNIVPVLSFDGACAHTALGDFRVSVQANALLLHPQGIEIADENAPGAITGVVQARVFSGESYRVIIENRAGIRVTFKAANHAPSIGDTVSVRVAPEMIVPLDS